MSSIAVTPTNSKLTPYVRRPEKEHLLYVLHRIRTRELDYVEDGICNLVALEERPSYITYSGMSSYMRYVWKHWPKYSGSRCYPVPHPWNWILSKFQTSSSLSEGHFKNTKFPWLGKYGKLRRELVNFMIEYITADLESENENPAK